MKGTLIRLILFFILLPCLGGYSQVPDTLQTITTEEEIELDEGEEDEEYNEEDDVYYDEDYPLERDGLREAELRTFAKDSLRKLLLKKEYRYMANLDSLLRHPPENAKRPDEPAQPATSIFDSGIFRFLYWALALAAVGYVLYQLLAGQSNPFRKNKKLQPIETVAAAEPAGLLTLADKAKNAAEQGNYRMATRFLYLQLLEQLGEKKMLLLLPNKTNNEYLKELKSNPCYRDFATLTLQYEYVWYGEFTISAAQYKMIENGFSQFKTIWV